MVHIRRNKYECPRVSLEAIDFATLLEYKRIRRKNRCSFPHLQDRTDKLKLPRKSDYHSNKCTNPIFGCNGLKASSSNSDVPNGKRKLRLPTATKGSETSKRQIYSAHE